MADKQPLALDGTTGRVWLAPDAEQLAELERRGEAWAKARDAAKQSAQRPAVLQGGQRILVAANINGPSDVALALDQGAEGVGPLPHRIPVYRPHDAAHAKRSRWRRTVPSPASSRDGR